MKKELIIALQKTFEDYAQTVEGVEFWYARDLQTLLDYDDWRNFVNVIEKAKISCKNAGQKIENHFVDVNKMVLKKDRWRIFYQLLLSLPRT